jgi:hypothetical protein
MRTRFARVVNELCAIIDLQVPPEKGMPDDTGYEECIVPTDMNLLSGKLFLIRTRLQEGWFLCQCCPVEPFIRIPT